MRTWLKALLASGAVLLSLVGLVGFAHTQAGKPMLHWLAAQAGCPASFDTANAATVEAYRTRRLQKNAGTLAANATPALGFELGVTSREQVAQWIQERGLSCEPLRQNSVLQCRDVDDGAAPRIADLHLQFDTRDVLVAVDVQRQPVCSHEAVQRIKRLNASLSKSVGPATAKSGALNAEKLEQQRFASAGLEFRYRNYLAKLSASHLGQDGITVREQYQWVGSS
jgi:hypothetical protein